jgi:pseudouridine kinase
MKGKGASAVVVVGTVFVDLKCFPQAELNFKGRNLGETRFYHGGVGRNVAETMALLGSSVRFASSVQQSGVGQEVLDRLQEVGVQTDGVLTTADADGHGMWVAILHRDGDLACSLSQMPNVDHLERAWERHGDHLLAGASLVVLELDLSVALAEQVLRMASEAGVRVIGLPGNFSCIRARPELLGKLDTFICNQYEAEELYGRPISSIPAAQEAARQLVERGLSHIVITLGALGSVACASGDLEPIHLPALPVEVVDTTGAGDAFVAGFSHAIAQGADLHRAVSAAARVAAWTVNAAESVCRDLAARMDADTWDGWKGLHRF